MKKTTSALPVQYKSNILFKNIFIKKGNAERSLSFLITLYTLLRIATKRRIIFIPSISRKRPVLLLDYILYKLQPPFIIRRVMAAGKPYMLPVPISEHRASYLACKWLRNAILADTKSATTIPHLMLKEIINLRKNKGLALQALQDYIKLAIDQRPFSRFLRKKFKRKQKQYHRIYTSKRQLRWRRKYKVIRWFRNRGYRKARYFKALKQKVRVLKSVRRIKQLYRHRRHSKFSSKPVNNTVKQSA